MNVKFSDPVIKPSKCFISFIAETLYGGDPGMSFLKKIFKRKPKGPVREVERYWIDTPHGRVCVIRYSDGRREYRGPPEAVRWAKRF